MIKINGIELEEVSTFPGGEVHIKLPDTNYLQETINFREKNTNSSMPNIMVESKVRSSNDLMQLILVKDALDGVFPNVSKGLKIMYLPYARQDRVCNPGEAFSAKVFASMLNTMEFDLIITADVHSSVILSYINTPVVHVSVNDIFKVKHQPMLPNMVLVAPDKGSYDKVKSLSEMIGVPFISATKTRTGNSIQVELSEVDRNTNLRDRNLLIVDDICDGGGTFIALSKELCYKNPLSINLYVTHGIFSKGIGGLRAFGISNIYTTDSIATVEGNNRDFFIWEL